MKASGLSFLLAGALSLAGAVCLHADEWDKLTKITFSGPVEVPGKVLPAGTYIFKLLDEPSDRNIVEIYNADQTQLQDLVLAVSDERIRPTTGKNVIQFSERPAGSAVALKAWFYPGSTHGEQFVYPHDEAAKLAQANHEHVYSTRSDLSGYTSKHVKRNDADSTRIKQAPVKEVDPSGNESDIR